MKPAVCLLAWPVQATLFPVRRTVRRGISWSLATTLGVGIFTAGVLAADSLDTWAVRDSGTAAALRGVARGNGRFLAVGDTGVVRTSGDGIAWEAGASTSPKSLLAIAFGAGNFVGVGGGGAVLRSTNGMAWETVESPTTNRLEAIAWCGDRFVATGDGGTLLSSTDGVHWTALNSGTTRILSGVARANDRFVVVGRGASNPGTVLTSSDGVDWTDQSRPGLGGGFYGITYGRGVFVASDIRGVVYLSVDGVTWTNRSTVSSDYVFGVTHALGVFVGVGGPYSGLGGQKIVTSADGVSWRLRSINSGRQGTLRAVVFGNGSFVAVGDGGLILQSGLVMGLRMERVAGGTTGLIFDGEAGRSVRLQAWDGSGTADWREVLSFSPTTDGIPLTDPDLGTVGARFYRVVAP